MMIDPIFFIDKTITIISYVPRFLKYYGGTLFIIVMFALGDYCLINILSYLFPELKLLLTIFLLQCTIVAVYFVVKLSIKNSKKEWNDELSILRQKAKITLVVGNGFDIDRGLHTSYLDFYKSSHWPFFSCGENSLGLFLNQENKDGWHNLEDLIGRYAAQRQIKSYSGDVFAQEDYQKLINSFKTFMEDAINNSNLNKNSYASELLEKLNTLKNNNICIYSFNYTDYDKLSKYARDRYGIVPIHHIHGSLLDDDIVLGAGDRYKLHGGWSSFYKTQNSKYKSSGITERLAESKGVIIFGHSLSGVDYPYFEDFFKQIARHESKCKELFIYTLNEDSISQIKTTLREMCDTNLTRLLNNTRVHFIKTMDSQTNDLVEHQNCLYFLEHNYILSPWDFS